MKPPIFIIGNPRSGTTLLRLMLNNHPQIVAPPECGFAVWWYERYQNWDEEASKNPTQVDAFLQDLRNSKKIETWNLDFEALRHAILAKSPKTYAELVSTVYISYGRTLGRTFHRWGDKNNFHLHWIPRLHSLFPNAQFLHIVRDGRDVVCSYRKLANLDTTSPYAPRLPTEIESIAREWKHHLGIIRASFSVIGWEHVHELRYEDLVTQPEDVLKDVCTFLDEPYNQRMLEYYRYNKEENQEPIEFLAWKRKTIERPTTSEVGKFRHELTDEEIRLFQKHAGDLLVAYGYPLISYLK